MKKRLIYAFWGLVGLVPMACNQDIEEFDNAVNYISIDLPRELDQYGKETTTLIDSMVYSFAMDDASVTSHTFKVVINSAGLKADKPRSYKVVVDEKGTTIGESDWDATVLASAQIDAGVLWDTLEVTVKRTDVLKTEWRSLSLRLEANENFQLGAVEKNKIKLTFTDKLQPPTWWPKWQSYFGVFVKETFLKWQEIYYLGADPNVEKFGPNTGKPLYWDNMPYYVQPSWYPSTFMFFNTLKQYFIDNEVYPDGDTSKRRITLPYLN